MTGFNSQVGGGMYRIQFETDNQKAYTVVQEVIRAFIDQDRLRKKVVSKTEKTTDTEKLSACNGVCEENTKED